MPAIAKFMAMKGHNGYQPCQACNIPGVLYGTTYYAPLCRRGQEFIDPEKLPLRSHKEIIQQAMGFESAETPASQKHLAKEYWINGLPVLATLSSVSMTVSFSFDIMHLILLNNIKNLLLMWTGDFKGMDTGNGDYQHAPTVQEAIGKACVAAGRTTPAVFGTRVPNIAEDRSYFTAKTWTIFATMLGPVLLRGRFI
ncbi:hypothetical protein BDV98DRAFT_632091 [Pterulicium gracile]|uniref:Uncharacterized protein n=1 Tax=Pterulicium gracile TaxID=1884261 RepID=A0A5C3Q940_9AGAR|nr:hypothetical protein BDV98DRAFT_632091 [Pterula gracilis]